MKKGFCLLLVAFALGSLVNDAEAQLLRRPLLPWRKTAAMQPMPSVQPKAELPMQGEAVQQVRSDLDPKSFAGALGNQLAKKDKLTRQEKHIATIINSPDSPRRDRQLLRMERHVRAHLDLHPTDAVDWSRDIDWPTLLQTILQLLIKLLPLFL